MYPLRVFRFKEGWESINESRALLIIMEAYVGGDPFSLSLDKFIHT
jgi:hypothetical protein